MAIRESLALFVVVVVVVVVDVVVVVVDDVVISLGRRSLGHYGPRGV